MTTSDCVKGRKAEDIIIRTGSNYKNAGGQLLRVSEIQDSNNLMSILTVPFGVTLQLGTSEIIKTVAKSEKITTGTLALVSGWGSEESTIRGAEVKIASDEKCKKYNAKYNHDQMVCVENFEHEPYLCFGKF